MNLYKISEQIMNIQREIEESDWEVSESFLSLFEKLQWDLNEKIDNCVKFMMNEEASAAALDHEIARLEEIKDYHKRRSTKMKKDIDDVLKNHWIEEMNTSISRLSYRSSEGVVVTNDALILDEYKTTKTTTTTSLTLIWKAIKAWVVVEGAFIEKRKNLQIK